MATSSGQFLNKPPTIQVVDNIGGRGRVNKQNFFYLTIPNTIREKATLGLIYPTPAVIRKALDDKKRVPQFVRITVGGNTRITVSGDDRVTAS
jgi:hypothetical protein